PVCHFTDHCISDLEIPDFSVFHLSDDITKCRSEQIPLIHIVFDLHTQMVSERHLAHRRNDAMAVERICGYDPAGSYIFRKLPVLIHNLSVYREVISISFDPQPYELIARFLQLRSDDIFLHSHVHGKGYKGRRHIDILECPGHTVLSPDRRKPKPNLSRIGAQ